MDGKNLTNYYYSKAWTLYGALKVARDAHERGRILKDHDDAIRAEARAEREELQKRVDGFRDEFLEKALEWRGISFVDEACDKCGGSGVVAYGSTATWHGGIGGQAITSDVCDKCWGSGSRLYKWADLRKLRSALAEKEVPERVYRNLAM